jgi:Nickel responsive protein SCO4226-like
MGAQRNTKENNMPKYMVERNISGAEMLTADELCDISAKSNSVVDGLGVPYVWHHSYVAGDKIYCVHEADSAEVIYRHAKEGGFPADLVTEIKNTIGPDTANRAA